jgi:hypothetical protein
VEFAEGFQRKGLKAKSAVVAVPGQTNPNNPHYKQFYAEGASWYYGLQLVGPEGHPLAKYTPILLGTRVGDCVHMAPLESMRTKSSDPRNARRATARLSS